MEHLKVQSSFSLPDPLEMSWTVIEPFFQELKERTISSVEELESWLKERSKLEAALEEAFAWRYIRMTCNTTDEKLLQDFQFFATEIQPKIAPLQNDLNKKLVQNPFLSQLNQNQYFVYVRGIKKALELFREENVPLLTQIQVVQQEYQSVTGSLSIIFKGQDYTLEQASVFLKDADRALRQQVWEAIATCHLQEKEKLNAIFNNLLRMRHQVALNAGFDNFRDYTFQALGRFDYTVHDCFNFHDAVQAEVVPFLKTQADQRKKSLQLERLKPWDLEVDIAGKPALIPFRNGQVLIDKTIACFTKLHPALGEKIAFMKTKNLFDVESRKGKAPGGYNYPLAKTGAPFIFMNSANTFRDLTTIVHEGGHAIHTFLSAHLELNASKHLPAEVAELASMSMELISMDAWDVFFEEKPDLKRAKRDQLKDVLKTLPWVATIDRFQHWLYTHPEHTVFEREEAWQEIFASFGNNFVEWGNHTKALRNLWQKTLHLFECPFYYIEYGIAQLGAIAIWKNYRADPERALQQYLDALALGYTKTIPEIYETAGIDFTFSREYIKTLIDFVKGELKTLE